MDQLLALRAFVRIAESGAFARAADQLNLPRSTVSKLIANLEEHLGAKLIQRTTRSATVTPEGADYYERAVRLLGEVDDMDAVAGRARARPSGRLRIDIGSSFANVILIPALPEFRALYPDVEIQLGVSDRPVDLIGEGVDCVIRGGELAETSLIARRLCRLDYVTCAAPAYAEKYGLPQTPSDIATGHHVLGYFSSLTGKPFPLLFHRGGEAIEIGAGSTVSTNESTAHMTALMAGLGVAQTFRFIAQPYLDDGRLLPALEDWSRPPHPLHVLYPPNRHLNARLRVFVDWVAGVFVKADVGARSSAALQRQPQSL